MSDDYARELLTYSMENIWIEDIKLDENPQVNYQVVYKINSECRENLLIREYIIPQLQSAYNTSFYPKRPKEFNYCF